MRRLKRELQEKSAMGRRHLLTVVMAMEAKTTEIEKEECHAMPCIYDALT